MGWRVRRAGFARRARRCRARRWSRAVGIWRCGPERRSRRRYDRHGHEHRSRPATTTSARSRSTNLIYQQLMGFPNGAKLQPVLATRCFAVGGNRTWRCNLRRGVEFHDGSAFDSADVKHSFDRVIKIDDPSGISSLLGNLKSTKTNGRYAVTFNLKSAQSTWPFDPLLGRRIHRSEHLLRYGAAEQQPTADRHGPVHAREVHRRVSRRCSRRTTTSGGRRPGTTA